VGRRPRWLSIGRGENLETLAARLTSAGFVDIAQRPYDPERDFRRDALHVDARKPGQIE